MTRNTASVLAFRIPVRRVFHAGNTGSNPVGDSFVFTDNASASAAGWRIAQVARAVPRPRRQRSVLQVLLVRAALPLHRASPVRRQFSDVPSSSLATVVGTLTASCVLFRTASSIAGP